MGREKRCKMFAWDNAGKYCKKQTQNKNMQGGGSVASQREANYSIQAGFK